MTRLELLAAATVLIAVCALSCCPPGYVDFSAAGAPADPSPFSALLPLQRFSFHVAALAVTLLGLLLEDSRRRALAGRDSTRAAAHQRRS